MFEKSAFDTGHATLEPGDALVLYTDGVSDAEDGSANCYSEERLVTTLERLHSQPVEAVVGELVREVGEFSQGEPQGDDVRHWPCAGARGWFARTGSLKPAEGFSAASTHRRPQLRRVAGKSRAPGSRARSRTVRRRIWSSGTKKPNARWTPRWRASQS